MASASFALLEHLRLWQLQRIEPPLPWRSSSSSERVNTMDPRSKKRKRKITIWFRVILCSRMWPMTGTLKDTPKNAAKKAISMGKLWKKCQISRMSPESCQEQISQRLRWLIPRGKLDSSYFRSLHTARWANFFCFRLPELPWLREIRRVQHVQRWARVLTSVADVVSDTFVQWGRVAMHCTETCASSICVLPAIFLTGEKDIIT